MIDVSNTLMERNKSPTRIIQLTNPNILTKVSFLPFLPKMWSYFYRMVMLFGPNWNRGVRPKIRYNWRVCGVADVADIITFFGNR